jgi:hypothetical protein
MGVCVIVPVWLRRWQLPPSLLPEGVELWVKRDDLTGMQLSGNKVGCRDKGGMEQQTSSAWGFA